MACVRSDAALTAMTVRTALSQRRTVVASTNGFGLIAKMAWTSGAASLDDNGSTDDVTTETYNVNQYK